MGHYQYVNEILRLLKQLLQIPSSDLRCYVLALTNNFLVGFFQWLLSPVPERHGKTETWKHGNIYSQELGNQTWKPQSISILKSHLTLDHYS